MLHYSSFIIANYCKYFFMSMYHLKNKHHYQPPSPQKNNKNKAIIQKKIRAMLDANRNQRDWHLSPTEQSGGGRDQS